ncbi:MAG: hypothetical protein ACLFM4_11215 [Phormidium sp.]
MVGLNVVLTEDDTLFSGTEADDTIVGSAGSETIFGLAGNDILAGTPGEDVLFGNEGNDSLFGGKDNDTLFGGAGNDYLSGDDGDDVIFGESGQNTIVGAQGDDSLVGGTGDDIIRGIEGNDTIVGTGGNNVLAGGPDEDIIVGGLGNDTILGGLGDDQVRGSDGNDLIYGQQGNTILAGNRGDDTLIGEDGDDTMFGGRGSDAIGGGPGNDYLSGDDGNDTIFGNAGDDTIAGVSGANLIYAGRDNDLVTGGEGRNTILGDDGDDTLFGNAGDDTIAGGDGNDVTQGGQGDDFLFGNQGDDTLFGDRGNDFLAGGQGNDYLVGSQGNNTLHGGGGADNFVLIDKPGLDIILDFNSAEDDRLLLGGLLTFEDIEINQGTGVNVNDAVITRRDSDSVIAILRGVPISNITEGVFAPDFADLPNFDDIEDDPGDDDDDEEDADPDANLTTTPQLRGAELLVANSAGEVGQVAAEDAEGFSITGVETNDGESLEDAITIESDGTITLTSGGVSALEDNGTYLDISIETDAGDSGTVRLYGRIVDALEDEEIGNSDDVSVGNGQDTIRIAAGTYSDALNLTESVTLLGANAGTAGDDSRGDESEITATVEVNANNVTLDGLSFTEGVDGDNTGNNLRIVNNIFEGVGLSVRPDERRTGVRIANNQFNDIEGVGISLSTLSDATVTGNVVNAIGTEADSDAIVADLLIGSTLSDNTLNVAAGGGSGIQLSGTEDAETPLEDITVSGNTINGESDAGRGRTDGGITLRTGNFQNLLIQENTVSGFSADNLTGSLLVTAGTQIPDPDQVQLLDNVFAAESPGFSVYVAATTADVPSLQVGDNFSEAETDLVADNVAAVENTEFLFS